MLLSCGVTTLAEGNTAEPAVTGETAAQENVSAEAQTDTAADDTAVVSESQEKMAAAETAETETEETASSDIAVQSETADTEGTESAQTEESTAADTTEQTAGTESGDAAVQSEEETTAGNNTAETSEPETSTENETQADTAEKSEKAAQPYSERYEDDTIKISVSAEAGIVPEGAKLSVTPIEKTEITDDMTAEEKAEAEKINDQYELTEKKLNEDSEENEETMEGFLAYDISFLVNGEEVEPSGDVNVIMEFKEAAIPEGVSEDAAVTVKHLKEDETAEDGVVVEDMAEKAEVQTTEKAEVETVELTADSFSPYVIQWYSNIFDDEVRDTVEIHYVDTQGNSLDGKVSGGTSSEYGTGSNNAITLSDSEYKVTIDGYNYQKATIATSFSIAPNATEIQRLRLDRSNGRYNIQYSENGNSYTNVLNNQDVYMVYEYVGTEGGEESLNESNSIIFWHQEQTDDAFNTDNYYPAANRTNWSDTGDVVYHKRNVVQFMVLLADEDGNIGTTDRWGNFDPNTELPEGAVVPDYYTFDVSDDGVLEITPDTFSEISVPGYSYSSAYSYFGWSSNHSISDMNEVYSFRNFGTYAAEGADFTSPAWTTSSYSYIGYHSAYNDRNNSGSCGSKDNGSDRYNYWYQTTGIFMIVLAPVSQDVTYQTYWHNDYNPGGSAQTNIVDITSADMYLDEAVNPKVWRGKAVMTDLTDNSDELVPPSPEYEFAGWWTERDAEGNGTGKQIASISQDRKTYVTVDGDVVIMNQNNSYYARWEKAYDTEPVNFYLNLSSQILDTDGNIGDQEVGDFTTSVSGNKSGINKGLYVQLPDDHNHPDDGSEAMGVIGGTSDTNARAVDAKIRELGTASGTTGNQEGHLNETYWIKNEAGSSVFPDDAAIFEYIRTNWSETEGQGVNKGKDITINGIAIEKENLTTNNFAIRWYVFKDDATDYWHIDGILVPKSGVLNITKTFANEEIANAVATRGNFAVNVTGNFLTGEETATISNSLADAEKTVNMDGTVTYSWSLAIFGEQYQVAEVNYDDNALDEWRYSGTEWTYISADEESLEGTTTSMTLDTQCQWTDTDNGVKTQTLNLRNYYSSENEDEHPFITVSKTFKGLSMKLIEELYEPFALTVKNGEGETVATLKLNDPGVSVSPVATDKEVIQDYTFTWKVENCETGTYQVLEEGEIVGQYEVTTTGVGENVTVSEATWTFDPNVIIVTENSSTSFTVGDNKIVMASLTGQDKGYVIWTNEQLTSAQRATVIHTINTSDEFSTFRVGNNSATKDNCHFYYGSTLEQGITLGKGTLTYKLPTGGNTEGTLEFGNKSMWQHIMKGSYTMTNAINADLGVTNTYTAKLDLKKVSVNTNEPISGAEFKLSKLEDAEWVNVASGIVVSNEVNSIELRQLEPGVLYKLEETVAPAGHTLLSEAIYFKAMDGIVTLCASNGVPVSKEAMWELSENGSVLTIKNNLLYELPEAGGSGIYWYMLGGVLLMMAGSLLVYKKRRGEVLRRK